MRTNNQASFLFSAGRSLARGKGFAIHPANPFASGRLSPDVAGIERAIKSCPAYGTLLHPPSVALSVERPAEAGTEAIPADVRAKLVG